MPSCLGGGHFQKHRFLRPRNEFPGFGRRKSDAPGQKAEVRRLNWRENGLLVRELRQPAVALGGPVSWVRGDRGC